jgi:hypothetical protein
MRLMKKTKSLKKDSNELLKQGYIEMADVTREMDKEWSFAASKRRRK